MSEFGIPKYVIHIRSNAYLDPQDLYYVYRDLEGVIDHLNTLDETEKFMSVKAVDLGVLDAITVHKIQGKLNKDLPDL